MKDNSETIRRLPKHLRQFIVDQNYSKYTSIDHAVWRYIMRLNVNFLRNKAHRSYIEGMSKTGISTEKIPKIDEMNEILSKIGWGAVCVDGFIPPSAFMEFQAYKILVIAADMRNINHIEYTPAPDIVHEAAGHAPIIVDQAYAEYLRLFGEIGSKAVSSKRDIDLYEAIRKISILKENPNTTVEQIKNAENHLNEIQNDMGKPSEMARLRNLHWWTVEYGLTGSLEKPEIYGAGLLSSIGESSSCLDKDIRKIPYSIAAADYSFDITTKQPHLFVCKDFSHLLSVLNEFADSMALRKGGPESVNLAIESNALATCQLSSGLQISGKFTKMITDEKGEIAYLNTIGPSMLSENDKMIIGHGKNEHREGFGTPIGKLKGINKLLEDMSLEELMDYQIQIASKSTLHFESGVSVSGILQYIHQNRFGKILIMCFKECTVTYRDKILFHPEWGNYDMAVGNQVISVFSGVADKDEYETEACVSSILTDSNNYTDNRLINLYTEVRKMRENDSNPEGIRQIFDIVIEEYPDDWLLTVELYELAHKQNMKLAKEIKDHLLIKANRMEHNRKLIIDGINLIEN